MSKIGVKLRDLASQRRPEDYADVTELFTHLQEHGTRDTSEDEAVDGAQAYFAEVAEPKKEGLLDKLRRYIKERDVNAVKDILHMLSERVIDGSGLNPKELEARRIAKEFVIRMQKLGKPSLKGRRNEAFLA